MDNERNNTTAEINAEGAEIAVNSPDSENNTITLVNHNVENKGNVGVYNHTFKKPFEYQGQKYKVICFNFSKLTGRDLVAVENEMMNNNEYALDPILSRNYLGKLASKASGIPSDVIEAMPASDFKKITDAVRNFLVDTE